MVLLGGRFWVVVLLYLQHWTLALIARTAVFRGTGLRAYLQARRNSHVICNHVQLYGVRVLICIARLADKLTAIANPPAAIFPETSHLHRR
jgi:hypothetical protein